MAAEWVKIGQQVDWECATWASRMGWGGHLDEAHLRPPSYRSHWTASGASWVANGFRLPERASQRTMRWSDRTTRSRFMRRGQRSERDSGESGTSSFGGGGLVADGMRPPGESRTSTVPNRSRVSAASAVDSASRGSSVRSANSHGAFSTNARISDMSSLSAGTITNAFRPPPSFKAPIGLARGSGSGLMP